jgi:hypothetical protein
VDLNDVSAVEITKQSKRVKQWLLWCSIMKKEWC